MFSESLGNKTLKHIINETVDRVLNEYLNENVYISYLNESRKFSDLGGFIKDLGKLFNVVLHNYHPRECGRCLAYITTDTFNKDDTRFIALMDEYQVFITSIDEFDAPEGTIQVNFEAKYGEDVTDYTYKSKVLYHLTSPSKIKQITKEGLIPQEATSFRREWYPERIYLLTDKCDMLNIKAYARQLRRSYIVICDLTKMGADYNFYHDPQSVEKFSIYTSKPIPKDCITIKPLEEFLDKR